MTFCDLRSEQLSSSLTMIDMGEGGLTSPARRMQEMQLGLTICLPLHRRKIRFCLGMLIIETLSKLLLRGLVKANDAPANVTVFLPLSIMDSKRFKRSLPKRMAPVKFASGMT